MLCRIFYSQGVQPARTLQLSYRTAQGSGTEAGFTAAGCVRRARTDARFLRRSNLHHVGAPACWCLFVLVFAVFPPACVRVYVCKSVRARLFVNDSVVLKPNGLVLGLELGAPNCVAAKGRCAAVPVNDV